MIFNQGGYTGEEGNTHLGANRFILMAFYSLGRSTWLKAKSDHKCDAATVIHKHVAHSQQSWLCRQGPQAA